MYTGWLREVGALHRCATRQSWLTSYLDSMSLGFAKLACINKSCLKNSSTKIFFVEDLTVD